MVNVALLERFSPRRNSKKWRNTMTKKPIRLLFDAMYHGKYEFDDFVNGDLASSYKPLEIRGRIVHSPNKKLKAYHAFIELFLLQYLPVNRDVVFSYRKGFSAYDAVSKHAGSKTFYQTDIEEFFPSLSADIVLLALSNNEEAPIESVEEMLPRILDMVTVGDSLPMGFSTSPTISNTCLFEFDNLLQRECEASDMIYTRYADDIIISSRNSDRVRSIGEVVSRILERCFTGKLKLNSEKTKYTSVGRKIKMLGMVILPNGKVTVDLKFKNKIEVLIHFYLNDRDKFMKMAGQDMAGGIERVGGLVSYANTIDKAYLDKLRKKFGATTIDMFLHKSAK